MSAVVRLGDISNHGGVIITACANVIVNGIHVAVNGSLHSCPLPGHGITAMTSNSTTIADGQPVVRVNIDQAGCGAIIPMASPDTFAG